MDYSRDGRFLLSRPLETSRWILSKICKKIGITLSQLNFGIYMILTLMSVTDVVCSQMPDKYPIEVYQMLRQRTRFGNRWENRDSGIWGPWSEWSDCTRSCGTGIQSQARDCLQNPQLLRKRSPIVNNNTINDRPMCIGNHKRYHICNTQECPIIEDFRKVQCAKYNGRIYKGHSYTWIPFLNAPNECALNCRAVGERFYATLESEVVDGTPCNGPTIGNQKPTVYPKTSYLREKRYSNSIFVNQPDQWLCVAGQCKPVGCDGVVGSGATVDSCGVCGGQGDDCKLYEGIFMEPTMPKGHQPVTTIPKGAMSLNISELRHSTNFLALRSENGSYILNGPRALSPSGAYRTAGTTLTYQRGDKHRNEFILATGPLNESLHLEILYNEKNPGVIYKYMLPITDGSGKKFEVSPLYFSRPSDPGNDILDSSKHLVAVSVSRKSDLIVPERNVTETYNYDIMDGEETLKTITPSQNTRKRKRKFNWKVVGLSQCSKNCGGGLQTWIVKCVRGSTQAVVADRRCRHSERVSIPPAKACNELPCGTRWRAEPWSDCSVTCGTGIRTRKLECIQESNSKETLVAAGACEQPPNVKTVEICNGPACHIPELRHMNSDPAPARWELGPWSPCSATCGLGIRNRTVTCITSREPCSQSTRPESEKSCELMPCRLDGKPTWLYSEWSTQCSTDCGPGSETRVVACSDGSELLCDRESRPPHERQCFGKESRCSKFKWFIGPWSSCSKSCGTGIRRRDVICVANFQGESQIQHESNCDHTKPHMSENCSDFACPAQWFTSDWTECSKTCDGGIRTRTVRCMQDGVASDNCTDLLKPPGQMSCNQESCFTSTPLTVVPLHKAQTTNQRVTVRSAVCIDKYPSCSVAVKNNLCRIKYYKYSCCGCQV